MNGLSNPIMYRYILICRFIARYLYLLFHHSSLCTDDRSHQKKQDKKQNKIEAQKRFSGNSRQLATLPRINDIVSLVHIHVHVELESSWCAEKQLIVTASACIPILFACIDRVCLVRAPYMYAYHGRDKFPCSLRDRLNRLSLVCLFVPYSISHTSSWLSQLYALDDSFIRVTSLLIFGRHWQPNVVLTESAITCSAQRTQQR